MGRFLDLMVQHTLALHVHHLYFLVMLNLIVSYSQTS